MIPGRRVASLKRQKIKFGAAAALWAAWLVVLALQPDGLVEAFLPLHFLRNLTHGAAYSVLAFFLCFFLRFKRSLLAMKMKTFNMALFSFLITTGWGGLTELIQRWTPDRTPSWGDLAYDGLGAAAGIASFIIYENLPDRHPCQAKTK